MIPVPFVRTTESQEVWLITINRQTSYVFGILCRDYGIIWGLPMNPTGFADLDSIKVEDLLELTETGGPDYCIGPDCSGRA